jgi:hypothetical protein
LAKEGKQIAIAGHNTQTNSTSDHDCGKSGKAFKSFRLGNFKSTQIELVHLIAVEIF